MSGPFGNFAVHPLLETLPDDEATLPAITEDNRAHGLRESIVLTADGGSIVDGRLRYLACKDLGVRPEFRHLPTMSEQELCAAVVSLNMKRRHLSAGQRAVIAAEQLLFLVADARTKQWLNSATVLDRRRLRDVVADWHGISGASVQIAHRLVQRNPELAAAVRSGRATLHSAAHQASYGRRLPRPRREPRATRM